METHEHELYSRFEQYLSHALSREEKIVLEQELEDSVEIRREFEAFLRSKKLAYAAGRYDQKEKLHAISSRHQAIRLRRKRLWIGGSLLAAVVVILFALNTIQLIGGASSPAEIFAENFSLPATPAPMGAREDSMLFAAHQSFEKGDFERAITLYQSIPADSLTAFGKSQIALFVGLGYMRQQNGSAARSSFSAAVQHQEQADWYSALSWLQEKGLEVQAQKAFESIARSPGHYYQERAKRILEKLE